DVLDLLWIEPDRLHRLPFALERQPGMPFNENQPVRRFDDALPAKIAFDPAAGELPDALDDRPGPSVGRMGLRWFWDCLVEIDLDGLGIPGQPHDSAVVCDYLVEVVPVWKMPN